MPNVRWGDHTAAPPENRDFVEWLLGQGRLPASAYRGRSLLRRLPACLRALRVRSVMEARQVLEREPALLPVALDAVLLGVTQFCRDTAVFTCLREYVMPRLLAGDAGSSRPLRVWSAGCSEGHELYSVALLLDGCGALERAQLLGTDCRETAVARARAGIYAAESLASVGAAERQHFLPEHPRGGTVRIASRLREATTWRRHDLLQGATPGPWDLILWRNLAIYFAGEAAEAVSQRIWRELRPGGYLVLGKADPWPRHLRLRRIAPCIHQKPEDVA